MHTVYNKAKKKADRRRIKKFIKGLGKLSRQTGLIIGYSVQGEDICLFDAKTEKIDSDKVKYVYNKVGYWNDCNTIMFVSNVEIKK